MSRMGRSVKAEGGLVVAGDLGEKSIGKGQLVDMGLLLGCKMLWD